MNRPRTTRATGWIAAFASLAFALAAMAGPSPPVSRADDMALGSPRAPVTVVEYASLGCPHCATWSNTVFPAFKKTYVDAGKVRFVFRELLYGDSTMAAAGFMLARCAGPRGYFPMIEAIFAEQSQIETKGVGEMARVAATRGIDKNRFEACLKDPQGLAAVRARSDRHQNADAITGTPTFVIGATRLEGDQSLATLAAAITAAQRRRP